MISCAKSQRSYEDLYDSVDHDALVKDCQHLPSSLPHPGRLKKLVTRPATIMLETAMTDKRSIMDLLSN